MLVLSSTAWMYRKLGVPALVYLAAVSSLIVQSGGLIQEKSPPVAQVESLRVVAHLGEDVRISCPVDSRPAPFVEWIKQGELVDFTWPRYKVHRKHLRIRNVALKDKGVLICKGINGFGSVKVKVELVVVGADQQLVPPVFTTATANLPTMYKKLEGSALSIQCQATGFPEPNMTWAHASELVRNTGLLQIPSIGEKDAGVYTCSASSWAGQISRQFYLAVESPQTQLPTIQYTTNTSVFQGEFVVLTCVVESGEKPDIKWFEKTYIEESVLRIGGMNLLPLGGETRQLAENKYESTYVINPAVRSQVYVCAVLSHNGREPISRTSSVTVLPSDFLKILPVSVMVLVTVVIFLIIIISRLVVSRQKIIKDHENSFYSAHIYDVPNYSPGSDTVSTPLSVRRSKTASQQQTYCSLLSWKHGNSYRDTNSHSNFKFI